jgi:NitT/TauT family transport system substrate-binding protein
MTMTSRRTALAATATLLLPRIALAQTPRNVVVGTVIAEDAVVLWNAINSGMFRRAGINIDFQRVASGSAATLGVIGGAYNIALTNPLSAILAHVKAVPLTILVFTGIYNGTTEYVAALVKKDSPLQTAADLNGKIHGTTGVRDLSSLALFSWMDQHGGDSKSLKVVETPYSVIGAALEEGRVDVGTLLQPFLASALASGRVRVFANSYQGIAPRFVHSVWVTTPAWAEANADTARRFARVMRESQTYCNAHRTETASLLAQNSGADLDAILRGGRVSFTQAFADPKDLQPLIDVAVKYGAIDKRFDAVDLLSPVVRGLRV